MGKRVSKEIKAEILGKVKAGQRVVELAAQYGISDKSIYGWLRQYLATIVDIATRQIVAHRIGKRHDSQMVKAP